jgi:glyoxylase-like metal-dependent hydrolase (beta-lactamase superfamily II)
LAHISQRKFAATLADGESSAAITTENEMLFSPQLNQPANRLDKLPPVARGVWRLNLLYVNVYFLESPDGKHILVDTGMDAAAARLKSLLPSRPAAVVLTHGHCDHAGGAETIARDLDVPVYAHSSELPFLTGRAAYLPEDLSAGGPAAFFCRFFRNCGFNLAGSVRPLPEDGTLPYLPGWRWLHTPGHSPGHISLFREQDRTLISGDAVLTTDVGSWASFLTQRQEFADPPAPSTSDWPEAIRSIRILVGLEPFTVAAGHGRPISGPNIPLELRDFVDGAGCKNQALRYEQELPQCAVANRGESNERRNPLRPTTAP